MTGAYRAIEGPQGRVVLLGQRDRLATANFATYHETIWPIIIMPSCNPEDKRRAHRQKREDDDFWVTHPRCLGMLPLIGTSTTIQQHQVNQDQIIRLVSLIHPLLFFLARRGIMMMPSSYYYCVNVNNRIASLFH